jgi:hypothetical protein
MLSTKFLCMPVIHFTTVQIKIMKIYISFMQFVYNFIVSSIIYNLKLNNFYIYIICSVYISVLSRIALSDQCSCHQCSHVRNRARQCECCVYFLHGKRSPTKRLLETIKFKKHLDSLGETSAASHELSYNDNRNSKRSRVGNNQSIKTSLMLSRMIWYPEI